MKYSFDPSHPGAFHKFHRVALEVLYLPHRVNFLENTAIEICRILKIHHKT